MPSHRIPLPEEEIDLHPLGEEVIVLLTDESDNESDDSSVDEPQWMPSSFSESSEDSSNDEDSVSEDEVNGAGGHAVRRPYRNTNTAIRSRGRGFDQGRGQNEQLLRNELLAQTFNGLVQYLEPEEIIDHRIGELGEIMFRVRWENIQDPIVIVSSVMRIIRPDMVMDYLQAVVARLPDTDLNSVDQQD